MGSRLPEWSTIWESVAGVVPFCDKAQRRRSAQRAGALGSAIVSFFFLFFLFGGASRGLPLCGHPVKTDDGAAI